MKTNFKLALATIIGFAAGCAAGFLFKNADKTPDSAKGDIAKVSKFNKNVVSPEMSAFQEKITSDPEELEKVTASLTVLTSRMTEFDELVKLAVAASEGNEELEASTHELQNIGQLAANARTNGTQALEALNAITEGKQPSIDYEQVSQNLALAFMMVDRQICVGKQYVCDVDAFMSGKEVEDYKELALARDLWAGYCAGEAVLTNDSEDIAYWSKQQNLLKSGTDYLSESDVRGKFSPEVLKRCLNVDKSFGLAGEGILLADNADKIDVISKNVAQTLILSSVMEIDNMNNKLQESLSMAMQNGQVLEMKTSSAMIYLAISMGLLQVQL